MTKYAELPDGIKTPAGSKPARFFKLDVGVKQTRIRVAFYPNSASIENSDW